MVKNWRSVIVSQRLSAYPALALVLLFYCWPALRAPLFGGRDLLSNLLPIVQYKDSILNDGVLPLYTDLWFGGRAQWQNPLWSFLYFPATIFWLLFPIPWAARVIITGHLIISAFIGWEIASRFLDSNSSRMVAALLFLSPIIVRLERGHLEKIYAWPWILLIILATIKLTNSDTKDGLIVGSALAMIMHAGANYFFLYTIVLLGFLGISRFSKKFVVAVSVVAIPAILLRLPSLLYMIDAVRPPVSFQLGPDAVFQALFLRVVDYEGYSFIGWPILLMIVWSTAVWFRTQNKFSDRNLLFLCCMMAATVFILMTTGHLYQGHHLLDSLRVVNRSMAFISLSLLLVGLIYAKELQSAFGRTVPVTTLLLGLSAVLALNNWMKIRPLGSTWLNHSGVSDIVEYLSVEGARSVWLVPLGPDDPAKRPVESMLSLIGVGLNQADIALPSWYYGEMGQETPIEGMYCGYSFDYLVTVEEHNEDFVLTSTRLGISYQYSIEKDELELAKQYEIDEHLYQVFRVKCQEGLD